MEENFNKMPDSDPTKKGIIKAIGDIKEDCMCGRLITKDTHDKSKIKSLLEKFNTNNLRIYNLPSAWRMFYTITRNEQIEIIAILLDWMPHKDYERILK